MAHEMLELVPLPARNAEVPARRAPDPMPGAALGPGWFDSSWELQRGLDVREDDTGEEALFAWIDAFVRAQRPAAGRTASPSASTAIA